MINHVEEHACIGRIIVLLGKQRVNISLFCLCMFLLTENLCGYLISHPLGFLSPVKAGG